MTEKGVKLLMNHSNKNQTKNLQSHSNNTASLMLIIGIVFISANLRASMTSVSPLISLIRDNLHISNTLAGMITTLPLFAFALFSPIVPNLARKFGAQRVLFLSLITLTIGILLRSLAGSLGLFLGTAVLGISISVGNVLLPSIIKREFPNNVGVITGVYSVSMNIFAALASGVSIPLAIGAGLGWTKALQIWAVLSFIAVILWIPQLRRKNQAVPIAKKSSSKGNNVNMWKSPLAWLVTLYMGLQSMVFFCLVAWLPDILIGQGMDSGKAGWMLSLMQFAVIPASFVGSVLAGRMANQRLLMAFGSVCTIIGLLGLLFPSDVGLVSLWIIILGIGGGITFILGMMFFSLRTQNADEAASLSGMAQSIGFLLAAFGPMVLGYLHDAVNSWKMPTIVLIGVVVLCWIVGDSASYNRYIGSSLKD